MADEIAKIGLDTADISRGIDRISAQLDGKLGNSAKRVDKDVKGLGTTLKSIAAFVGLHKLATAMRDYGEEVEKTRSKLVVGSQASKNFEQSASISGKKQLDWARRMTDQMGALWTATKGFAIDFAMVSAKTLGADIGMDKDGKGVTHQEIIAAEEKVVAIRANAGKTEQERISLLDAEIALEEKKIEYYSEGAAMDREQANAAKERFRDLSNEVDVARESLLLSEQKAAAERVNLLGTRMGFKHVGAEQKIIAEYADRIAKAYREGRHELVKQLETQKQLAIEQAKAARARETPETRREARREARMLTRDARRDDRRQAEFQRRTDRGIRGERGSPLAEFQMGVKAPVAADNGMAGVGAKLDKIEQNTRGFITISK